MSLMGNNIRKISGRPECPEITTLFLQRNDSLVHISDKFFKYTPTLVVLNLSGNRNLSELPKQISKLISLCYLNLSRTGVKQFQVGLQELKNLIYLNLERTEMLERISGISHLSSLRTLGLRGSKKKLDMSLLNELLLVEYLEYLTIDISSGMVWEKLLSSHMLVKCIQKVGLGNLEESVRASTLPTTCDLRNLSLLNCRMREIQIEKTVSSLNNSHTTPCFPNLSNIYIYSCKHLIDLTCLVFAPNLGNLIVEWSKHLEEIISEEKAASVRAGNIVPFRKLRCLTLFHLPQLKSIYWSPLSFPSLNKINITDCPNLKKLPLDSKSVVPFKV